MKIFSIQKTELPKRNFPAKTIFNIIGSNVGVAFTLNLLAIRVSIFYIILYIRMCKCTKSFWNKKLFTP
jgi:hypothetical protein